MFLLSKLCNLNFVASIHKDKKLLFFYIMIFKQNVLG